MVYSDTERRADGILTAVALAYRVFFFILHIEVYLQFIHNLAGFLRQTIFFGQRENSGFNRGQTWVQVQYGAAVLFLVCT